MKLPKNGVKVVAERHDIDADPFWRQRIEKIEVLLYKLEKSGALQPPEQRKC